jgi:hypothetical protein
VLLGGCRIESKIGFAIWSGPYGGLIVVDGGYGVEPVFTFSLSGLPRGVSYFIV